MNDSRLERLADLLVHYSAAVRQGDLVSLVGPPLAERLMVALYRAVVIAGGHPLVVMAPEACKEILYREGSAEQLSFLNPLDEREVEAVDVSIHVLAAANSRALRNIEPGKQALHARSRRPIMEVFLRRAAEKTLRWVAAAFPCQASAQEAGMALADYEDIVFTAGLLDQDDPASAWRGLSDQQARLAAFLRKSRELRFVTPGGTDLRVGVVGRTWINGDGHENMPDGEVYTAPLEDSVEGTVSFDLPALHAGREVDGVRLIFRGGRVVDASAARGESFLVALLDQDAGARALGEVGIGCNYAIRQPTRHPLLDEKMGGTFHVALGAAYPQTGGRNESGLHWDLVCDLRRGGRMEADGRLVSENGKFADADWPRA